MHKITINVKQFTEFGLSFLPSAYYSWNTDNFYIFNKHPVSVLSLHCIALYCNLQRSLHIKFRDFKLSCWKYTQEKNNVDEFNFIASKMQNHFFVYNDFNFFFILSKYFFYIIEFYPNPCQIFWSACIVCCQNNMCKPNVVTRADKMNNKKTWGQKFELNYERTEEKILSKRVDTINSWSYSQCNVILFDFISHTRLNRRFIFINHVWYQELWGFFCCWNNQRDKTKKLWSKTPHILFGWFHGWNGE